MELPPPRGGIRQRALETQMHVRIRASRESTLYEYLLEKFAWGTLSATAVKEIAERACEDMAGDAPDKLKAPRQLLLALHLVCLYRCKLTKIIDIMI